MKRLTPWFGAVAILLIIFGTIYVVTQQAQRNDANYPQIQLAEDTATYLNNGGTPPSLTQGQINLQTSLQPFIIIYDKNGRVLASSGLLNGQSPKAPLGILKAANGQEYHAVTWQPQSNVRIAAVTVAAHNYYVLSGRSLKLVEANENQTLLLSALGGIVSIMVLGAVFFVTSRGVKK